VRRAVAPPGEALPDWQIARNFALRLAPALGRRDGSKLFPYFHAEQVFLEHAESTRGRDLDITGLDYAVLDRVGPQQWPMPAGRAAGTPRLYADGRFARPGGRARFVELPSGLTAEQVGPRFPLHLTSGRLRDQWHGMSRTGKLAQLFNHGGEPRLLMHAADMERRGLAEGDFAAVSSRRGMVVLQVAASPQMRSGQTFLAMHWGRRYLGSDGANALIGAALDPVSGQPELKHSAVQAEKIELPWQALVLRLARGADAQGAAVGWLEALQPLLPRFRYAALSLAGREQPLLRLRIAHDEPIPSAWLAEIETAVRMPEEQCLSYADRRRGISKLALLEAGSLAGLLLNGETAAGSWLAEAMLAGTPAEELRRWLFAPSAAPPAATKRRGRILCNCHDVAESEITEQVAAGADLQSLQEKLRCGTSCGSCLPEIRRILAAGRAAA
jgi:assimilatory nitrate reductase catalytic subunit